MGKQFVSGDQAVPRKTQHKRPCSDCPWARKSLSGWTGATTPEQWIALAHGEGKADCHTVGNQQCAGLATYRANVCKSPRDPATLTLPRDTVRVFGNPHEFLTHHKKGD